MKRQVYFNSAVRKILYELIQKNYEQSIKEKDFNERLAQLQERIEKLSQVEYKLEDLPQLRETKKQLTQVEQKIEILPIFQDKIEELTQLEHKIEQNKHKMAKKRKESEITLSYQFFTEN